MKMPPVRGDLGITLDALMRERDFSVRQLAAAVAELKGTKPETERRKLNRVFNDGEGADEETVAAWRSALGVAEADLPTPERSRMSASKAVRLLEPRVEGLAQVQRQVVAELEYVTALLELLAGPEVVEAAQSGLGSQRMSPRTGNRPAGHKAR